MKPLCGICGTRHEAYQGHVFASNAVSASMHLTEPPEDCWFVLHPAWVEQMVEAGISLPKNLLLAERLPKSNAGPAKPTTDTSGST